MGADGDAFLYPEWGTVTITFVTPLPAVAPDFFSTSYGTVLRVEGQNSQQVGSSSIHYSVKQNMTVQTCRLCVSWIKYKRAT